MRAERRNGMPVSDAETLARRSDTALGQVLPTGYSAVRSDARVVTVAMSVRKSAVREPSRAQRIATVALIAGAGLLGSALPAMSSVANAAPESVYVAPGLPTASAIAGETDGLDPVLAAAYSSAADAAREEGVTIWITSGYRSPAEQQALWEDGIHKYGSPEAARKWVLPPEESTHVSGQAIDVGPRAGAQWLEDNGNRWGLCRTYDNEWWHFELVTVPGMSCPARLPDASVR